MESVKSVVMNSAVDWISGYRDPGWNLKDRECRVRLTRLGWRYAFELAVPAGRDGEEGWGEGFVAE